MERRPELVTFSQRVTKTILQTIFPPVKLWAFASYGSHFHLNKTAMLRTLQSLASQPRTARLRLPV